MRVFLTPGQKAKFFSKMLSFFLHYFLKQCFFSEEGDRDVFQGNILAPEKSGNLNTLFSNTNL